MVLRVAAASWRLEPGRSWDGFEDRLGERVAFAVSQGAQCVVFPELLVLDLLGSAPQIDERGVPKYLASFAEPYVEALQRLASRYSVSVVGGSHFEALGSAVVNVCAVATPSGVSRHAKNRLTEYERSVWDLSPGAVVEASVAAEVGVLVCYDSEFPEAGRLVAESGCRVLCIPAFTETEHGFHRVRYAAHARAVENQMFVVHASLVGTLGREPVPSAIGSSAVIAPSHAPFPADGLLAESVDDGLAVADLEFDALERCRAEGDVRNWNDRYEPWIGASSRPVHP